MYYWAQAVAGRVMVDSNGDHDLYFADGLAAQAILSDDTPNGEMVKRGGALLAWRDTGAYVEAPGWRTRTGPRPASTSSRG
ncbi:hypothetical protein ACFTSD_25865 [Nocardiaceae bacterium NPDC056970]